MIAIIYFLQHILTKCLIYHNLFLFLTVRIYTNGKDSQHSFFFLRQNFKIEVKKKKLEKIMLVANLNWDGTLALFIVKDICHVLLRQKHSRTLKPVSIVCLGKLAWYLFHNLAVSINHHTDFQVAPQSSLMISQSDFNLYQSGTPEALKRPPRYLNEYPTTTFHVGGRSCVTCAIFISA